VGRLIYLMNVSLDGFIETVDHRLDWAVVDDELHVWFNEHARAIDASLYGRRLYELMAAYWPTAQTDPAATDAMRDFGRIWEATPRFVFSTTRQQVEHNSRLVSGDVGQVLAQVRREFDGDLEVAGPNLAHQFIQRGLVDEFRLVVHPVVLDSGTPYWPPLAAPLPLRLAETHAFASGVVYLGYRR